MLGSKISSEMKKLFFKRVEQDSHMRIDLGKLIFSGGEDEVFSLCELSVLALFLYM